MKRNIIQQPIQVVLYNRGKRTNDKGKERKAG